MVTRLEHETHRDFLPPLPGGNRFLPPLARGDRFLPPLTRGERFLPPLTRGDKGGSAPCSPTPPCPPLVRGGEDRAGLPVCSRSPVVKVRSQAHIHTTSRCVRQVSRPDVWYSMNVGEESSIAAAAVRHKPLCCRARKKRLSKSMIAAVETRPRIIARGWGSSNVLPARSIRNHSGCV